MPAALVPGVPMLSRALFLAQATTALAAALVLTHAPHPTTAARVTA
jgi:hypothetical protein